MAVIKIDGKDQSFVATAATWHNYRRVFKSDLLTACTSLARKLQYIMKDKTEEAKEKAELEILENFEMIQQAAYILHEQSRGPEALQKASYENYLEWLSDFSPLAFLSTDAAGEILSLLFDDMTTQKKMTPPPAKPATAKKTKKTTGK